MCGTLIVSQAMLWELGNWQDWYLSTPEACILTQEANNEPVNKSACTESQSGEGCEAK